MNDNKKEEMPIFFNPTVFKIIQSKQNYKQRPIQRPVQRHVQRPVQRHVQRPVQRPTSKLIFTKD